MWGGVWQDTEGKVWNGSAWVEAWSANKVIFVSAIPSGAVDLFVNGSFKNVSGITLNSNTGTIVGKSISVNGNQFIDFTNNTGRNINLWVECHDNTSRQLYMQLANGSADVSIMINTGSGREEYNTIADNETTYPGAVFYGSQYGNTRLRYDSYTVGEHVTAYLNTISNGQRFGCGVISTSGNYVDRISIV